MDCVITTSEGKMLLGGKKFRVSRAGSVGVGRDGYDGVYIELHRRQANFVAASLVTQL
jgi:hypothetical protein